MGFVPFVDGGSFVGPELRPGSPGPASGHGHQRAWGRSCRSAVKRGSKIAAASREFRRMIAAGRGRRVLETQRPSHGAAFPFLPVIDDRAIALRPRRGRGRAERARRRQPVGRHVRGASLAADKSAGDAQPCSDALPTGGSASTADPAQRRQRVSWRRFASSFSPSSATSATRRHTVEDVHWIGIPSSQAVLDTLVDRPAGMSVLLPITHRPQHRCQWTPVGRTTSR